ncbi:MAG: hypothetical protein WD768_10585, partial [Phycisphaeraceae bacterium]
TEPTMTKTIFTEKRLLYHRTHSFETVVLLRRDPNYRPPIVVNQQPGTVAGDLNVRVKHEKDALDALQQVGEIGVLIKSLRAVR